MKHDGVLENESPLVCRSVLGRLLAEVAELDSALSDGAREGVLDEVVDVIFFARELARAAGIPDQVVHQYGMEKSELRMCGMRDKRVERRIAAELLSREPSLALPLSRGVSHY